MYAYRFRVYSEDFDDFQMYVELLSVQTFFDFHQAIKKFLNINSNELASFYLCDDKWRKIQEITLIDMKNDDESNLNTENKFNKKPMLLMEKTRLNNAINNPHQKMLYIYDYAMLYTFQIELVQIFQASSKNEYPVLVKKEGTVKLTNSCDPIYGFSSFDIIDEKELSDQIEIKGIEEDFFDIDEENNFLGYDIEKDE